MQALIAALNARENYTAEHSEAVVALALAVGGELGLEEDELRAVGHVALLHDIGKVGVPDAILQKDGGLTAPEWEVMRQHPAIGARIVGAIGSLAHLAPAVRAEHERWDGAGLSGRPRRRGDPALEPHLLHLRRLARDDLRPPVPARARGGGRARRARAPRGHAVLPDRDPGAPPRARPPRRRAAAGALRPRRSACRRSGPTARWRPSCAP